MTIPRTDMHLELWADACCRESAVTHCLSVMVGWPTRSITYASTGQPLLSEPGGDDVEEHASWILFDVVRFAAATKSTPVSYAARSRAAAFAGRLAPGASRLRGSGFGSSRIGERSLSATVRSRSVRTAAASDAAPVTSGGARCIHAVAATQSASATTCVPNQGRTHVWLIYIPLHACKIHSAQPSLICMDAVPKYDIVRGMRQDLLQVARYGWTSSFIPRPRCPGRSAAPPPAPGCGLDLPRQTLSLPKPGAPPRAARTCIRLETSSWRDSRR
jgi:hypothetical protein